MGPIALFDSGLGGLTVLSALKRVFPTSDFAYLGDSARTPYGSKGPETVKRYARECAEFLNTLNPTLLVVACNTASAVALNEVRKVATCPVYGTIEAAALAASRTTKSGAIAVLSTRATSNSEIFPKTLHLIDKGLRVVNVPCPLLVPLVEEGVTSGPVLDAVLDLYLKGLRFQEIDTVILGCTHYPLLTRQIQSYLGPLFSLVECSTSLAQQIQTDRPDISGVGSLRYFTTDDPERFCRVAKLFTEYEISEPTLIALGNP